MPKRSAPSPFLAGVGFGAVVALVALLAVLAPRPNPGHDQRSQWSADGPPEIPDQPYCPGGVGVTLDEARRRAPFRVLFPKHPIAHGDNVDTIWWCPGGPFVAIHFTSGVKVILEANTIVNAEADWARTDAKSPEASVGTVRGELASLIDPEKDPDGRAPGGVELIEEGLHIIVAGNGSISLSELIQITESLTSE